MIEVVVGVVFTVIGAIGVAWSVVTFASALSSPKWPAVPGVVAVSDLQRSRGEGGFTYRAEISYRYLVDGTELVSNRAQFGDRIELSWSSGAVRLLQKYPVGRSVNVYYNPYDPEEAVLETGVSRYLFAMFIGAVIFLIMGIMALR